MSVQFPVPAVSPRTLREPSSVTMRVEQGFQPAPFPEDNPYTSDPVLPSLLKRILPQNVFGEVEPDLVRLGDDVNTKIRAIGSKVSPPKLTQYDQWGRRIDELETSEGWRELKALSQREGIPGIFYERKYGEHSRAYGFAKMILMVGDTHVVFCPLSMTDGTARVIELHGSKEMKEKVFPRLISREPSIAFTSGQWMTERPGGSDVSQTETVATSAGKNHSFGPQYTLNGFKWFSSATDSQVSVALARTGTPEQGSRGLSLFLIPLRLPLLRQPSDPIPSSISNGIFVHRLKNKIGTHTLPTAELSLEGTNGYLIGSLGQGVKSISPVLNITRLWSAIASIGALRRSMAIATAFSKVRSIQGGKVLLQDSPIHVAQLAWIHVLYRALTHLTFGTIVLLGKVESKTASEEEKARLRILTPVAKAFSAEKAVAGMEEAMTALGGAGYMEENGFGRLIRDALVEKIWEGTTTVLSLDIVRAVRDTRTRDAFTTWVDNVLASCPSELPPLAEPLQLLRTANEQFRSSYGQSMSPLFPRIGLLLTGYLASSVYLLEHAVWAHKTNEPTAALDVETFRRWVLECGLKGILEDIQTISHDVQARIKMNNELVYKAKL